MKKDLSLQAERLIQNNGESTEDNFDDGKFKSESMRQDLGIIFRGIIFRKNHMIQIDPGPIHID